MEKTSSHWPKFDRQASDTLFTNITKGGRGITYANLDGYFKQGAITKAIAIFRQAKGKKATVTKEMMTGILMKEYALPKKKADQVWQSVNNNDKVNLAGFRDWASELLPADVAKDTFLMH